MFARRGRLFQGFVGMLELSRVTLPILFCLFAVADVVYYSREQSAFASADLHHPQFYRECRSVFALPYDLLASLKDVLYPSFFVSA